MFYGGECNQFALPPPPPRCRETLTYWIILGLTGQFITASYEAPLHTTSECPITDTSVRVFRTR